MSRRRVVVTGLGLLSPVGNNVADSWQNILSGVSGASAITGFDTSAFGTCFSASVKDFDLSAYMAPKEGRKMDLFMQYGMAAAIQAIEDADLEITDHNAQRVGVAIGSGIGGLPLIEKNHETLTNSGPRRLSPFFVPGSIINMISGNLSIKYGMQGPNIAITTACTTGTHNIGASARMIAYGDADAMVCGGAEMATTPLGLGGFGAARALSTRNDDPQAASRPWDLDRDGFVLGDGAGVLVLEEYEQAKARGARIYAELAGFGMSGDAFHITLPPEDGKGAAASMRNAMLDAGLNGDQIHYINAHGTSTPVGDVKELSAIKEVFGDSSIPLIGSTKSLSGHALGAAGVNESIYSLLMLQNDFVAESVNIENLDIEATGMPIVRETKDVKLSRVLSNSFGFGGTNACLVFEKFS